MRLKGWKIWAAVLMTALTAAVSSSQAEQETGWYMQEGVYCIVNFEGLEALSEMAARSERAFTGEVHLMRDIEAVRPLVPIGSMEHMFCGIFDGKGYTISNLTVQGDGWFQGMFGYVGNGGCVRNLTLLNVRVSGTRYCGGVAGYSSGSIEECRVENGWIIGRSPMRYGTATGGIVGLSNGTLTGCVNQNTRVEGERCVGGIVGTQCAEKIERCANTGEVRGRDGGEALTGGIAGSLQTGGRMRSCINTGSVYAPDGTWIGGVTGGLLSGGMTGCASMGEVCGREPGGLIGYAAQRTQVMCCLYAGSRYPGAGEGRQDGIFVLSGDEKQIGRAYELLRPLIEQREHHSDEAL